MNNPNARTNESDASRSVGLCSPIDMPDERALDEALLYVAESIERVRGALLFGFLAALSGRQPAREDREVAVSALTDGLQATNDALMNLGLPVEPGALRGQIADLWRRWEAGAAVVAYRSPTGALADG